MKFKLYDVPDSLKNYVKAIWSVDTHMSEQNSVEEQVQSFMVKSGSMLCCYKGDNFIKLNGKRLPQMAFLGPNSKVFHMSAKGDFCMLGMEFYPLVSYILFRKNFSQQIFRPLSVIEIADKELQELFARTIVMYSENKVVENFCSFVNNRIQSFETDDTNFDTVKKALGIIREQKNPSQDEVARECFISKKTLLRLMQKYVGLGFKEYVNVERCCNALKMLKCQDLSIEDVAERCGYGDRTSLCRDFRSRGIGVPSDIVRIDSIAPDHFNTFYYPKNG